VDDGPRRREPLVLPAGIRALGPEAEAAVQRLVEDAERRQEHEAAQALEHSLRIVPRPLRGVVRRVLLG